VIGELTAAILFTALLCGAVFFWRWRAGRPVLGGFAAPLLLLALWTVGFLAARSAERTVETRISRMVTGYARTYARETELLGHARIGPKTLAEDAGYLALIAAQRRWLEANPEVADIYTFRRLANGQVVLLVDSETDYDRDGQYLGQREARSAIGEPYPDVGELTEAALAGRGGFDSGITVDRWGSWVSAFEPLRLADGSVEAVLGVDFDSAVWLGAVREARRRTLLLFAALAALALAATVGLEEQAAALRRRRSALARLEAQQIELEERNRELEIARDKAQTADKAKVQFLANVSHEFRTPMNEVLGMVGLLLDTDLGAGQREQAETIQRAGRSLLALINDILHLSRLEAGRLPLEEGRFHLREVIDSSLSTVSMQAAEKNLEIRSQIAADIADELVGDASRIQEILIHLLTNAVKFTERGSVHVAAELVEKDGERLTLRLLVEDTGRGIPVHLHENVFELFTQVEPSAGRKREGTGLGLAICRRLAAGMGGEIGLESEPGHGSRFIVTLPLRRLNQFSPKTVSTDSGAMTSPIEALPLRILIAEDNPVNQRVLALQLEAIGHRAALAANGAEVLEALSRSSYDLVLMDVMMPGIDGVETTRRALAQLAASDPGGRRPWIVALTASAQPGDQERCREAGMDDYLSKPLEIADLRRAVRRAARRRYSGDSVAPPTAQQILPAEPPILDPARVEALRELDRGLSRSLFKPVVENFVGNPPFGELKTAFDGRSWQQVRFLAHRLKGSAANLGASRLAQRASRLERTAAAGDSAGVSTLVLQLQEDFAITADALLAACEEVAAPAQ
jgi:signal transduction histidine kinase/DNA-binding response OmpR family regulator